MIEFDELQRVSKQNVIKKDNFIVNTTDKNNITPGFVYIATNFSLMLQNKYKIGAAVIVDRRKIQHECFNDPEEPLFIIATFNCTDIVDYIKFEKFIHKKLKVYRYTDLSDNKKKTEFFIIKFSLLVDAIK